MSKMTELWPIREEDYIQELNQEERRVGADAQTRRRGAGDAVPATVERPGRAG